MIKAEKNYVTMLMNSRSVFLYTPKIFVHRKRYMTVTKSLIQKFGDLLARIKRLQTIFPR